jgi:hypothetical protein
MYTINYKAYEFELFSNNSGLFDEDIINATYIIHLENNGRYDHILEQIKKFKTTNKIYILHNKGFKSGLKQEYIDKAPLDLVDAFLTCFKHASNNNYKNVLIFEDDFICDEKLLDKSITNDIVNFIRSKTKQNELFIYFLGVLPYITSLSFGNHRKCFLGLGTHATIYSNKFIKKALEYDQKNIDDWDYFVTIYIKNMFHINSKYMYNKCLCYQPFTETENSKYWALSGGIIGEIYKNILREILRSLKFDKEPKDGFNKAYENCIKFPNI